MTSERRKLAEQQAALLEALLSGGPSPAGFDEDRVHVERKVLRAKRRRVVGYLRPDLPDALGGRFAALFDTYADERPKFVGTRAREDAAAFAAWLVDRGELPKPRRWNPFRR
ncbi:hypothetical protein [Amycolatopsis sp. CA-230715]|uniref:hypothetical protein n=1 Tax=Amycolatopsis sp. CA-230715 TaxID=2745196 RepID=UPI001C018C62|nr:hypothetical protein [Amycolatopsis sp. CA-230715]QWF76878.1 hypothetical protein HUW46_00258 [Amycolatopsis sp. CA-230715]